VATAVTCEPDTQLVISIGLIYTDEYVVSNHKEDTDDDSGLAIEEKRPDLKPPKQYKVVLINDDYTPMEFVVQILMTFFGMDHAKATRVMMAVHTKGRGVCGIFSHEIAETKVEQVNEFSRLNQHPLLCTMEEA